MPELSVGQDGSFVKFVQFVKMEESKDGAPTVWGIATHQMPDLDNECCIYEDSKPAYEAWSAAAAKRTAGAGQAISLGNIRLQHGLAVGGKATKLEFDDDAKQIWLGSEPIDDTIKGQLKQGFYTGYSQGGSYAYRKCSECDHSLGMAQASNYCPKCKKNVTVNYGLKSLAEVSYVDSPCTGEGFESVKANGSREVVKFQKKEVIAMPKTKRVAGKDLEAKDFAYVGDPDKTATWKFPIHDAAHVRNALARFDQAKGIPESEKPKVKAKIDAKAKEFGIDVADKAAVAAAHKADVATAFHVWLDERAVVKGFRKGLYTVSRLASVLEAMSDIWQSTIWERDMEGDDSEVPESLSENLESLIETFLAMAEEEAKELAAVTASSKTNKGETPMTPEELEALKVAKKSKASHFAKSAMHHEKMEAHETQKAEHHEAHAAVHKSMHEKMKKCAGAMKAATGEVNKEDVSSGAEAGAIHEVTSNLQEYHKAAESHHEKMAKACHKCAKAHGAIAEAHHSLSEMNDAEEHEKTVKAIKAVVDAPEDAVTKVAPAVVKSSLEADVAASEAEQRESPEYKKAISDIAKGKLDIELQKMRETTLVPDGVKIVDIGKGSGVRAVERDKPDAAFKLAAITEVSATAGL